MTKKEKREQDKKQRVLVEFNTGERMHRSKKDYQRKKDWRDGDGICPMGSNGEYI